MNRFRKIFISVMLTFILATGCGAANAAPTQQATTQEQAEQATTQEQAEQATTQRNRSSRLQRLQKLSITKKNVGFTSPMGST